jgi:hypothetical protein
MEKRFVVSKLSVNLTMIENTTFSTQRESLYARPLRITPDSRLGAIHQGRVHPIYLDELGNLSLIQNLESYDLANCEGVEIGDSHCILYALEPLNEAQSCSFLWEIVPSQFGIYIYLKMPDDVVEKLVVALCEKGKYRVVSWDATDYVSSDNVQYGWFIQLSSGLSSAAIGRFMSRFFEVAVTEAQRANKQNVALESENKLNELELRIQSLAERKGFEIEHMREELQSAYQEISNLHKSLAIIEAEREAAIDRKNVSEEAKQLKRSASERVLACMLHSLYRNIAFSPESPRVIIERFENSAALWELLNVVNRGGELKKVSLHGGAGKVGWREVKNHISTGADSRGRMYVRAAKGAHKYDVVLHWKKNDAEQERLIKRLGSYSFFEDPNIILSGEKNIA